MDTQQEATHLDAPNTEFGSLIERLHWGPGITCDVLGRNRKTVKRWIKGTLDVERSDLALVREIVAFVDRARSLMVDALPGTMTAEDFRTALYAMGWSVRNRYAPSFGQVTGIPEMLVRRMASGKLPVPQGLQDGLELLMTRLDEPPVLAARLKAQAAAEAEGDDDATG